MEPITSQILRPGTLAMAVAAFIITFFVRRIVVLLWPKLHNPKGTDPYTSNMQQWWNSVIIYAVPVTTGMMMALSKSVWLFGDIDTFGGKALFGGGVGWFASFLYKILRKVIQKQAGVELPDDSDPPAADEPKE